MRPMCTFRNAVPALLFLAGCGGDTEVTLPEDAPGTVRAVARGLSSGQPDILWAALPDSYRRDLNALVHEFGGAVDPTIHDQVFVLLRKAARVFDTKRDFFLGSKLVSGAVDRAAARRSWSAVVEMIDTLASSELSSAASVQTVDVGSLLRGTARRLMAQFARAAAMAREDPLARLRELSVQGIRVGDFAATLQLTVPDKPPVKVEFSRFEGRWLPVEMIAGWDRWLDETRKAIADMPLGRGARDQAQVRLALSLVDGVLDRLAQVEDQEEFDETVAELFGDRGAKPGR